MYRSVRILLIIKNPDQRKLYHEFLVNSGYVVYLCDELANALLQLLMFPSINSVMLGTGFSQSGLEHFFRALARHDKWKKLDILLVDTADKGNICKEWVKNKHFFYTQEIDPRKIILELEKLIGKSKTKNQKAETQNQ